MYVRKRDENHNTKQESAPPCSEMRSRIVPSSSLHNQWWSFYAFSIYMNGDCFMPFPILYAVGNKKILSGNSELFLLYQTTCNRPMASGQDLDAS